MERETNDVLGTPTTRTSHPGADQWSPASQPSPCEARQLWIANWSDREDADFRWAWERSGTDVEVVRVRHLGSSVPQGFRRAYSWPGYRSLATEAVRRARHSQPTTVIAWQAIAGGLAAVHPGWYGVREQTRLIAMNPHPLQTASPPTRRQNMLIAMMKRVDAVVFYSRAAVEQAVELGLDRRRCHFIPLGVRPRRQQAEEPGRFLLAIGRSHRDWATLAAAAERAEIDVLVSGPERIPDSPRLHRVDAPTKSAYLALVDGARAVVIPLKDDSRQAGHLAVLDVLSMGRAVITNDVSSLHGYVTESTGAAMPTGDVEALSAALKRFSDAGEAARAGEAALELAHSQLNLTTFVSAVSELARSVWDDAAVRPGR